jgi:hypothetical protein
MAENRGKGRKGHPTPPPQSSVLLPLGGLFLPFFPLFSSFRLEDEQRRLFGFFSLSSSLFFGLYMSGNSTLHTS